MTLPDEVLIEILTWLPIKPLFRFKCVSKTWFRLLTVDPHFINLHLHRLTKVNPNPSILVLHQKQIPTTGFYLATDYRSFHKVIEFESPFNKSSSPRKYTVFGICNGLLCLSNSFEENHSNVYVWNPLIGGDHITIQCSPVPSRIPSRNSTITLGFGFHEGTNEYKVIRIVSTLVQPATQFQSHVTVYTLGTDLWRTLEDINYSVGVGKSTLVNGALHWLAARPGPFSSNILSFDIKDEVFQEVPQPNDVNHDSPYYARIGELGGLLCMFFSDSTYEIQMWVMKEYGVVDSWAKLFKTGQPLRPGLGHTSEPIAFASCGEIIIRVTLREFVLYNPKTNSITHLSKFGYYFIGSLVSPSLICGAGQIIDAEESGRKKSRADVGAGEPP